MIWPCVAAEGHRSPVFIDDVLIEGYVSAQLQPSVAKLICCEEALY